VDLDAPVGRYLFDIPEPWKRATIRQIATHTGGIPDYEEAATYAIYETSPTIEELLSSVAERPLDFEPGTRWSYSNTGYVLLSLVIEKLTGQRYGDFMRDELFAPLGLRETFVAGRTPLGLALVQGCKPAGRDGAERSPVRPISEASTYGAAGVLSTLEDWALWDDALADGRLLSAEAMAILTTPQTLADGALTDYGFGLEIGEFRGRRSISHSGQTQGFTALYETYPEEGTAVMVWVNQYGSNPAPLFDALRIKALPDASYDRLPAAEDPDPARAETVGTALRQYYLGEAGVDRLDPELRAAAASQATATTRARLRPVVAAMTGLQFLRSRQRTTRPGETVLYRVLGEGRLGYFSVGVRDGVVDRVFWEQE
jgi:CubicO group peptidase (beta-lactamase class C family)